MRNLHFLVLSLALLFGCAARGQHIVEIRPTISGTAGELRFIETDGAASGTATNYVAFKPSASISANVTWTLPATDGTSGQALVTNGSGVLSWGAGGGGATLPVSDSTSIVEGSVDATKQMRFEVDDFLTTGTTRVLSVQDASYVIAGTNIGNLFTVDQYHSNDKSLLWADSVGTYIPVLKLGADDHLTVQTGSGNIRAYTTSGSDRTFTIDNLGAGALSLSMGGHIQFDTDSLWNLGTATTRVLGAFFDDATTEDLFFRRQAAVSHDFSIRNTSSNVLEIDDSAGADIIRVNRGSTPTLITFTGDLSLSSTGAYDIGSVSSRWGEIWGVNLYAGSAFMPDSDGGADLGSLSVQFGNAYITGTAHVDAISIDGSGSILPESAGSTLIGNAGSEIGEIYSFSAFIGDPGATGGSLRFYNNVDSSSARFIGSHGYSGGAAIVSTEAFAIGASGSFYVRTFSGADVNCTGVTDGWMGYRLDTNEIQICDGGAVVVK